MKVPCFGPPGTRLPKFQYILENFFEQRISISQVLQGCDCIGGNGCCLPGARGCSCLKNAQVSRKNSKNVIVQDVQVCCILHVRVRVFACASASTHG